MSYARDERQALCALLAETGPDQPTLCAGWRTGDLAGHLVLRERRPDAALGMAGGPLAARTQRMQDKLVRDTPFAELVALIAAGPPRSSVFALPGADERLNPVEFFIHHEDVRRGAPGWAPRALPDGLTGLLWSRLGFAKRLLRKAPVGVEFARADEPAADGPPASLRLTVKSLAPLVTVTGTPAELTLWAYGRRAAARVRFDGPAPDIDKLMEFAAAG